MSKVLEAEGVINRVGEKVFKGKTYYNFTLVDDETLYRTGDTDPSSIIEAGDEVEFEYEDGKYGCMVDMDTLEVVGHQEPAPRKSKKKSSGKKKATASRGKKPPAASGTGGKMGKDDYWAKKEKTDEARHRSISYNAAMNTAIALVSKELDAGLLSLGKQKGKALDAFEALVFEKAEELWERFADAATRSPGAVKDVAADEIEDDQYDGDDDDGEWDDD